MYDFLLFEYLELLMNYIIFQLLNNNLLLFYNDKYLNNNKRNLLEKFVFIKLS